MESRASHISLIHSLEGVFSPFYIHWMGRMLPTICAEVMCFWRIAWDLQDQHDISLASATRLLETGCYIRHVTVSPVSEWDEPKVQSCPGTWLAPLFNSLRVAQSMLLALSQTPLDMAGGAGHAKFCFQCEVWMGTPFLGREPELLGYWAYGQRMVLTLVF